MKKFHEPQPQRLVTGVMTLSLLSSALLLGGCLGDGGDDTTPPAQPTTTNQTVKVVDGPIRGALVCLDANDNGACGADEVQGSTGADGTVTLAVPNELVGKHTVLALVGTDAVDADNGPVTTAFSLRAPADKPAVVSPLTTLVVAQQAGTTMTSAESEKALQDKLGLSGSLFADFSAATDDQAKQAANLARVLVLATQQQASDTANAKDAAGNALSANDRTAAINNGLLAALPTLVAAANEPAVTSAANATDRAAALAAAAQRVVADSGITAANIATLVAVAKLPPAPEGTAAPAAGGVLRWFTYSNAQNYNLRMFKATAEQNVVVDGKRLFTEYRERSVGSNGNVTTYQQWGEGLNNWARNQVYWTGTEWFACPSDYASQATPWDARGRSDSNYCKAFKATNQRSARDISGVKLVDLVKEIRAYPGYDNAGNFSDWGPDPVAHADKLGGVFPAGSQLYYYAATDLVNPDAYGTTTNDILLAYTPAVANGVQVECNKVSNTNFATFQSGIKTLEEAITALPGKPCVYNKDANGEANDWWSNSTADIGDVPDAYVSTTGTFKNGVKSLRFSLGAGNVANYWLCLHRKNDNSVRNCTAAGTGSYSIEALADGRVLRLAGVPAIAGNLSYVRTLVERGGRVYYGFRSKLTVTQQLRPNHVASQALFDALGMPAPRVAAPLTASSLVASYLNTAGTGTVNRSALASMENNNASIVGAWALSATDERAQTFFFFANGDYVMADPVGDDGPSRCGGAGIERGTYQWNSSTGALTVSTTTDTNGCAGLHDTTNATQPVNPTLRLTLAADGKTLNAVSNEGSDVVFRLTK